jgi:hypothetical protein
LSTLFGAGKIAVVKTLLVPTIYCLRDYYYYYYYLVGYFSVSERISERPMNGSERVNAKLYSNTGTRSAGGYAVACLQRYCTSGDNSLATQGRGWGSISWGKQIIF